MQDRPLILFAPLTTFVTSGRPVRLPELVSSLSFLPSFLITVPICGDEMMEHMTNMWHSALYDMRAQGILIMLLFPVMVHVVLPTQKASPPLHSNFSQCSHSFQDRWSLISSRPPSLSLFWMPGSTHTHKQPHGLKCVPAVQSSHRQVVVPQEHFAVIEEIVSEALVLVTPKC